MVIKTRRNVLVQHEQSSVATGFRRFDWENKFERKKNIYLESQKWW